MDYQPVAHIRCLTGNMTVTPTLTAARVGSANLTSRKQVIIFNKSASTVYWSFGSTTDIRHCNAIVKGAYLTLNLSEDVNVYLRTATAGARCIINELS